ncbi:MAG: hypothetical protein ABC527_06095 [Candidatus Methanosuratincola petrocarbonis]
MLGGYGKPLAIMMVAVMLPIYGSIFLMMMYPKYAAYVLAAGIAGVALVLMLLEQYKHAKYQGKRAIALTRRLPGGVDDLVYIVYGMKLDLPQEGGKYVCAVQDCVTKSWYQLISDHPMGDINYLEDTIPVGSFFVKMPVAYIEGAQLRVVERPLFDLVQDQKLLEKLKLTHPQDQASVQIPQIYVYGTSATAERIFAGQPLDSPPPTPEALKNAYAAFADVDPEYSELQAKVAALKKEHEKLEEVVDSFSERIIEYGDIELVESTPHVSRWLLILGGVALVALAAFLLARWMGWI